MQTRRDFEDATSRSDTARTLARWYKRIGKLSEYKTAAEVWPDRQHHGDHGDTRNEDDY